MNLIRFFLFGKNVNKFLSCIIHAKKRFSKKVSAHIGIVDTIYPIWLLCYLNVIKNFNKCPICTHFGLAYVSPIIYPYPIEREKASQRKEVKMTITCSYCEAPAISGADLPQGGEYYPLCQDDLARLVSKFGFVAVALQEVDTYCGCGCE